MSTSTPLERPTRFRLTPMLARDPHERGRTASSLELFFDLVFVVAVSIAAQELHHALSEDHVVDGVLHYLVAFFGIWWAWMNFTWFATSYAAEDWLYRVLTIVQMSGVLVLAAGVHPAFVDNDYRVLVVGYVIMRVAMITQWLRASRRAGERRMTTLSYAAGIGLVQVLWLAWLALPPAVSPVGLVILIAAELAVPPVAERHGLTPWHAHHITERYGLFTLIVLGESLLASANAVIEGLNEHDALGPLVMIAIVTLVVTAGLWWIYFYPSHHQAIRNLRTSLRYGYGHYFIFAAAGAFSAGIELAIDVTTHHSELSAAAAGFAVTIPIAVVVLGVWWLAIREQADRVVNVALPVGALLILLDPLLPGPLLVSAVIMVAMVAVLVVRPVRTP